MNYSARTQLFIKGVQSVAAATVCILFIFISAQSQHKKDSTSIATHTGNGIDSTQLYTMSLRIDSAPVISQSNSVTVSLMSISNDSITITVRIPDIYTIDSYSETPNNVTTYLGVHRISWEITPTIGVTTNLTVNTSPNDIGIDYHRISAAVRPFVVGAHEEYPSISMWARVGQSSLDSVAQFVRPPVDELAAIEASSVYTSTAEPPLPTHTGPYTVPVDNPLVVVQRLSSTPELSSSISVTLAVTNTSGGSISYNGTITIPVSWTVVSGSTNFTNTLTTNETFTHTVSVQTQGVPDSWDLVSYIDLDESINDMGALDYLYLQDGVILGCAPSVSNDPYRLLTIPSGGLGESIDTIGASLDYGPLTCLPNGLLTEGCCGEDPPATVNTLSPNFEGPDLELRYISIEGHVGLIGDMEGYGDAPPGTMEYDGGDLRVRILTWAAISSPSPIGPHGDLPRLPELTEIELARVLTNDSVQFAACIPVPEAITSQYLLDFEVAGADTIERGEPSSWSSDSVTVISDESEELEVAHSGELIDLECGILPGSENCCGSYWVDVDIADEDVVEPLFLASFISVNMRNYFVAAMDFSNHTSVNSQGYPVLIRWGAPSWSLELGGEIYRWKDNHVYNQFLTVHEYWHHIDEAVRPSGVGYGTKRRSEGFADFVAADVKHDGQYRHTGGVDPVAVTEAYRGTIFPCSVEGGYIKTAAWFWDLHDQSVDSMSECAPGALDKVNFTAEDLVDPIRVGTHDITSLCGESGTSYFDRFVSLFGDSLNLRVVSRHHQIIGEVAECVTPTVSPTFTPTATPTS